MKSVKDMLRKKEFWVGCVATVAVAIGGYVAGDLTGVDLVRVILTSVGQALGFTP